MLFLNDSSTQRSSQTLHADRDATDGFYAASTFPVTSTGRSVTKYLTGPVTIMYIVCFSIAGMAVLLNSVVLAAVLRYCRKPRPYTILVLNLCAADCILSTTTIAVHTLQYIRLRATDNGTGWGTSWQAIYCSQFPFQEIAWTVALYGSLLTIVTMSAYHLVAVRWPHSKICLESEQCIAIALVLTWSLALGLGLPQCFIVATSYHHKMENCSPDLTLFCCKLLIYRNKENQMDQELHKKIVYSILAGVIIAGFVVILCVYSYLMTKSWIMRHVRMITRKTQESSTAAELAWRRLVATTAMLLTALCVFWLPYVAYLCLSAFEWLPDLNKAWGQEQRHLLKVALPTFGCLCGIADPFIYGLRVPEVRTALQKAAVIRCMLFARETSIKNGKAENSPKSTLDV